MLGRLTLICSGATAATRQAAFPLDEPLEPGALALAGAVGGKLRRADRVWTATSLRARQTATALGLSALEWPELDDQRMGGWAGRSLEQVAQLCPDDIAAWLSDTHAAPHGGESLAELVARTSTAVSGLLNERGHTIAVTHAANIRAAILHVLGAPLESFWRIDIEPLSVTEFRSDGRRWTLHASGVMLARAEKPIGRS